MEQKLECCECNDEIGNSEDGVFYFDDGYVIHGPLCKGCFNECMIQEG